MERKRKTGLGSMLLGLSLGLTALSSHLGTVYTASAILGGFALAFLGFRQYRHPERFTTDEPPSRQRLAAVIGLAVLSFAGGFAYALA